MEAISVSRLMRGLGFGGFISAMLLIGSVASAQQQVAPTFSEEFDSSMNKCLARCEAGVEQVMERVGGPAPKAAKAEGKAAKKSAKRSGGSRATATATATASASASGGELKKLRNRLDALDGGGIDHGGQVGELRKQLNELQRRFDEMPPADGDHSDHDRALAALSETIKSLSGRLAKLEAEHRAPFGNSVGLTVSLLTMGASDGFSYVGPSLGGRLNIGLGSTFYAYVEPSVLVAPGDRPFSAGVGAGIGAKLFGNGRFAGALEAGIQNYVLAIGNDMNGKVVTSMGALGFVARLPGDFRASGTVLMGPKFDPETEPNLAIGGLFGLGYDFR